MNSGNSFLSCREFAQLSLLIAASTFDASKSSAALSTVEILEPCKAVYPQKRLSEPRTLYAIETGIHLSFKERTARTNAWRLLDPSGSRWNFLLCAAVSALLLGCFSIPAAPAQTAPHSAQEIWRFDRTDSIGGHPTTVLGHPQVVTTPYGNAVRFNGTDDALFVGVHPLAEASTWTWEVIFEPDSDGAPQQRFFHLSVLDPQGKDTSDRMLFEIRIVDGAWCLDSLAMTGEHKLALLNCRKRYPLGKWYRVTAVYDGTTFSNYVSDELQGQGRLDLAPQGEGRSSIETRINQQDFFKGVVYEARFTRKALSVGEFLKIHPSQ